MMHDGLRELHHLQMPVATHERQLVSVLQVFAGEVGAIVPMVSSGTVSGGAVMGGDGPIVCTTVPLVAVGGGGDGGGPIVTSGTFVGAARTCRHSHLASSDNGTARVGSSSRSTVTMASAHSLTTVAWAAVAADADETLDTKEGCMVAGLPVGSTLRRLDWQADAAWKVGVLSPDLTSMCSSSSVRVPLTYLRR